MVVGTLFTWFLMPSLLRLGEATSAVRDVRAEQPVLAAD
jgi:hypothetical protein